MSKPGVDRAEPKATMTGVIATIPRIQFSNALGLPLAGGKLTTYLAGTTAPEPTYQDQELTIENPTTITLDSTGSCVLWLDPNKSYKFLLKNALGVTQPGWPIDNVAGASTLLSLQPTLSLYAKVSALAAVAGSALLGFIQAGVGAVKRTVQDKLRDTVSVADFGSDDSGAATTINVVAFEKAAALGKDVIVPKPASSYYLESDPEIADNVNIIASPDWFTGPGRLPMHRFVSMSEGVDPRTFSSKGVFYSETEANETKRKWPLMGWLWIKSSPNGGSEGTATDGVGVDGRVVVDAPNGRGWGVVGLAQMTAKSWKAGMDWVTQALAAEFDVNNNTGVNCSADGSGPNIRAIWIASGGANRPFDAVHVLATKTPSNGLGDNRFLRGIKFYQDSCADALIYVEDGNTCDVIRIPSTSRGLHFASNNNLINYYFRASPANHHLELTIDQNQAFDIYNSANQKVLSIGESSFEPHKPIGLSENTHFDLPGSINAGVADVVTFGVGGTVVGGITGGVDGQTLTVLNASGTSVTINRSGNMRTAGGAAVTLANLQVVQFVRTGGTFFQLGSNNNA